MRVASLQSTQSAMTGIQARQAEQDRLQNQLSTGLRVNAPSDDPVAAAQAELARSRMSRVAQDQRAAQLSTSLLVSADNALAQGVDLMQDMRDTLVAAANGSYSPAERGILADALRASRERLLAVANARDSSGGFVFSGQGSADAPLSGSSSPNYIPAPGEQRLGEQGRYAGNVDGRACFVALPQGNGVFLAASAAGNTGSGTISPGHVSNASQLTGHDYQITITGVPGALQYTVVDATAGTTLSSGTSYDDGAAIAIDGQTVVLDGTPSPGDRFDLKPAGQQSVFQTVDDAIALLENTAIPASLYAERLQGIQTSLDGALDQMVFMRTKVGEELNTTDNALAANAQYDLQLQTRRSDLRDLDYAKAVSEMQVNQTALQAALKSYASFARLSLFDTLS
ncbi:MAG: flagellar hook-associated protein FlgL [Pseudomonadota bacterium]